MRKLKQLYRQYLEYKKHRIVKIVRTKFIIGELLAIQKKKKLVSDIKWTREQQKEFDSYWEKNYGKKIKPYWHKLYQKCNGSYNIEYFPEYLYTSKLEFILNPYWKSHILADKSLTETLYGAFISIPKMYGLKSSGIYYGMERRIIAENIFFNSIKEIGTCVIKPTIDSSSGNAVQLLDLKNGYDKQTNRDIVSIIGEYRDDFVIQEKIEQHVLLSRLNSGSLNTFRVITYICEDDIFSAPLTLRLGTDGSVVDNIHAGGLCIHVEDDGSLFDKAYKLGYGDNTSSFSSHPDSGVKFKSYTLPFVPDIIAIAKKLHAYTPGIGIISWDFSVDINGRIVLIEANITGQSVWFPQMVSGKSLFGDNTEKMINYIHNK